MIKLVYLNVLETLGKMEQDTLMIRLYMGTKRHQRGIIKSRKLLLKGRCSCEGEIL